MIENARAVGGTEMRKNVLAFQFTRTQCELILSALYDAKRQGGYYGRRDQYDARLQRLIAMFEGDQNEEDDTPAVETGKSGIRFPNDIADRQDEDRHK